MISQNRLWTTGLQYKPLSRMFSINTAQEYMMQRTLIDTCCLSPESHSLVNVWMTHLILSHSTFAKHLGIQIRIIHLCRSCLFPYQTSQTESWGLSLLHFQPRTKISGKLNREKHSVSDFSILHDNPPLPTLPVWSVGVSVWLQQSCVADWRVFGKNSGGLSE